MLISLNAPRYRKLMLVAVVCFLALSIVAPSASLADEASGTLIRSLVSDVRAGVELLEQQQAGFSAQEAALGRQLEDLDDRWSAATNAEEEALVASEIRLVLAKLNRLDRDRTGAVQNAIAGLLPKMERLREEIGRLNRSGHASQEEFEVYRAAMSSMLQGVKGVKDKLTRWSQHMNPVEQASLSSLDQTVVIMYKALASATDLGPSSLEALNVQIESLDTAFSTLEVVDQILEQERVVSLVDNYGQVVSALLNSLTDGAIESIPEYADAVIGGVDRRTQVMQRINNPRHGSGGRTRTASMSLPNQQILAEVKAGRFPWTNSK